MFTRDPKGRAITVAGGAPPTTLEALRQHVTDAALMEVQGTLAGFDVTADALESPIERIFFWAILAGLNGLLWRHAYEIEEGDWIVSVRVWPPRVRFHPQWSVRLGKKKYRLDFAVVFEHAGHEVKVAVECDGHDFHERTKEQAARDKQRDRDLQTAGWLVARFTGSEIYRTPAECVLQLREMGEAALREKVGG